MISWDSVGSKNRGFCEKATTWPTEWDVCSKISNSFCTDANEYSSYFLVAFSKIFVHEWCACTTLCKGGSCLRKLSDSASTVNTNVQQTKTRSECESEVSEGVVNASAHQFARSGVWRSGMHVLLIVKYKQIPFFHIHDQWLLERFSEGSEVGFRHLSRDTVWCER